MGVPFLMMAAEAGEAAGEKTDTAGYLLHHVQDAHEWELPGGAKGVHEYKLHDWLGKWAVNLGGHEIDLTPTRFTLVMLLGSVILVGLLLWSMRGRGQA